MACRACEGESESSGEECEDRSARDLSDIGLAAYHKLRRKHNRLHHAAWNVSLGKMVGPLQQTPYNAWDKAIMHKEGPQGDEWFPRNMGEIMKRATTWVDVASLGPPDGKFLEAFKDALSFLARKETDEPIVVRLLFGNIVGMPVNCHVLLQELTESCPDDPNIRLWVGAWRKGVSWNHSKIIAVDGRYLHTGGHNLWDQHYLKNDPVHDVSIELEGPCACDGHRFCQVMWDFVQEMQGTWIGSMIDKLPDNMPTPLQVRVTVSEYPEGEEEFPPQFDKEEMPHMKRLEGLVPIITIGRYGSLLLRARPSDDAIWAMFDAAQEIIRLSLQDMGPICLPGMDRVAVPGCVWPAETLKRLGRAILERQVDVEIVLSNPGSVPGSLGPTEALYGNGWHCADVAAEIVKAIYNLHWGHEDDSKLRQIIQDNLRLTYLRQNGENRWSQSGGSTMGNHAKFFIIDDKLTYVGSQNMYMCDLAEWGVVIDHEPTTKQIMKEYWTPMWTASYDKNPDGDCDVDEVMDHLWDDRNGGSKYFQSAETKRLMKEAQVQQVGSSDAIQRRRGLENDDGD